MKKFIIYLTLTLSICFVSITSVFAYATTSTATIHIGEWSAETDAVGASKTAYYVFDIWKSSKASGD